MATVAAIAIFSTANDFTHRAIVGVIEMLRDIVGRREGKRDGIDDQRTTMGQLMCQWTWLDPLLSVGGYK